MGRASETFQPRRLAAPRTDRGVLVDPPFHEVGRLVAGNVELRGRSDYEAHGRSLARLSEQARSELLAEARRWTAAYRSVAPASEDPRGLIFLAGHQPELFHPGVWLKNFALGVLAREHGAAAVDLVIDSDTVKHTSLRTPGGSAADPQAEMIPLDRPEPRIPYEERRITDGRWFAEFGPRAAERLAPLVPDPLVRRYWPMVLARSRQTDRLGYCLAQARHQLEAEWGLETLEVPQSLVCESKSFRWFAAHLIAEIARFGEAYNEAVREYRRAHRLRSEAQPVPDLAAEGPWREAPLWIWTAQDPRRRRLFVRREGRQTVISDREALELRLPLEPEGNAADAVAELDRWSRRGVKIRSRALLTTLWARLALGDLFLHGIGGAKYDEVTDRLIERFFGLPPPGIMVLSATLHLPVALPEAPIRQAGAVERELREMTFHPERFLRAGPGELPAEAGALIAAKQRWIQTPQSAENTRARWQALRAINEALQPWLAPRRKQLVELKTETARALHAEQILHWREYGFCLHPEKNLREFFAALLPKNA